MFLVIMNKLKLLLFVQDVKSNEFVKLKNQNVSMWSEF